MIIYILLLIILLIIICFIFVSVEKIGGENNAAHWPKEKAESIRDEFYKYYKYYKKLEGEKVDIADEISSMVFASEGVKRELLGYEYKKYGGVITNEPAVLPVVYALAKSLHIDPSVKYYLLLSEQKKELPKLEINSAEYHPNTKSIFVFRKEEWVKTLIHEMMHSRFGKKYKARGCPDEAIVETMAQFINCAIADGDWQKEIDFGLAQSAKIIPIFGKGSPAYEYHFISTLYKMHIAEFLRAVETDDYSFFKNYSRLITPLNTIPDSSPTLRMSITEQQF